MKSPDRTLTEREKAALAACVPQEDLDSARLREGRVPWYLPARFAAITRGRRIYLRPEVCRTNTVDGLALLAHELAHVGQYRRGATWLDFVLSYLRHGYRNSPLEIEARRMEERVRHGWQGKAEAQNRDRVEGRDTRDQHGLPSSRPASK